MAERKSILILGSNGFLGRHLVEQAGELGLEVVAASRSAGADSPENVVKAGFDLEDPASVHELVERFRPEMIINAAGIASGDAAWSDPDRALRTNVGGAFNLLEAVRSVDPETSLTLISSAAVYGRPEGNGATPFSESDPMRPDSPYGAGKAAMEMLAGQFSHEMPRLRVSRLFNLIGPGQPLGNAPSDLVGALSQAPPEGTVLLPIRNPEARRDFIDVRDAAAALLALTATRDTQLLNLCSGTTVSVRELGLELGRLSGREITFDANAKSTRPNDADVVAGDPSLLERSLSWQPRFDLSGSLDDQLLAATSGSTRSE